MKPILTITDLKVKYSKKQDLVLKGINLDVYPGEIIGYIGPNGAGKSTTIKVLLGLIDKYKGNIKIFGQNIKNDKVSYKKNIGYVPESADIYENLTAYEYLMFSGELYGMERTKIDERAKKLLSIFEIEQYYHSRISSFSKGMKQKLLIVASMVHDPDILFLDEPINGLDANSVAVFKEILAKLAEKGKTIFYSSHIMEVVEKISNRILILNNGEIIADGTFESLKNESDEGSLQDIFNQLTGFSNHEEKANEYVSIVTGDNNA